MQCNIILSRVFETRFLHCSEFSNLLILDVLVYRPLLCYNSRTVISLRNVRNDFSSAGLKLLTNKIYKSNLLYYTYCDHLSYTYTSWLFCKMVAIGMRILISHVSDEIVFRKCITSLFAARWQYASTTVVFGTGLRSPRAKAGTAGRQDGRPARRPPDPRRRSYTWRPLLQRRPCPRVPRLRGRRWSTATNSIRSPCWKCRGRTPNTVKRPATTWAPSGTRTCPNRRPTQRLIKT